MKNKKGSIAWDEIGKWILMLVVLIILIFIIMKTSGLGSKLFDRIKDIFRFGI